MIALVNNTPELLGGFEKRNERNQNIGENEAKFEQPVIFVVLFVLNQTVLMLWKSGVAKQHPN